MQALLLRLSEQFQMIYNEKLGFDPSFLLYINCGGGMSEQSERLVEKNIDISMKSYYNGRV